MKKKVIALMLAMSMTFTFSACGASEDSSSETAQEDSASGTEDAVEESSAEDTEEESDAGEAVSESADEETEENEEESEEVNEYGFTESQQEALVESVKNAITTDFLEPYNISPSEFELQPYDVNDMSNYDSGNYLGSDPYQSSRMWYSIDRQMFLLTDLDIMVQMILVVGDDVEYVYDEMEEMLGDGTVIIPETFEIVFDDTEMDALAKAVYKGIVAYMNGLETREYAELLSDLCLRYINNEYVDVPETSTSVPTTTLFDKVITENIQFE